MKKTFVLLLFIFSIHVFSQIEKRIVSPPYYIKTAWIDNHKKPFFSNLIPIHGGFSLSFDDLQADEKEYYYKIRRFDENWEKSTLRVAEYIDGFDSDLITDVLQSTGTWQSYTHYKISFPNENTKILLSGNYVIQILDEDDNLIFSKAFILYQKKIEAGIKVKWPEMVSVKEKKQQVDFFLYPGSLNLQNESENLKIVLLQNMNWSTKKVFHAPKFYQGAKWIYHFPLYALFDGLNEFRRFETKDVRGMNYNIVKREKTDKLYDFYIYPDAPRKKYTYYKDADGVFYILSVQAQENVNIEADYVYVHFSYNGKLKEKEKIYVTGRFNNFLPGAECELKFNTETNFYEAVLLLKQGYYEYMYLVKNGNKMSYVPVEGNFSETENRYDLIIYYRAPGKRYTEVIGHAYTNSINLE